MALKCSEVMLESIMFYSSVSLHKTRINAGSYWNSPVRKKTLCLIKTMKQYHILSVKWIKDLQVPQRKRCQ